MNHPFVLRFVVPALAVATAAAVPLAKAERRLTERAAIALRYIEALETVKRQEAYSSTEAANGDMGDAAALRLVAGTTFTDAQGTVRIEQILGGSVEGLEIFAAHSTTSAPPTVRYIVGVDGRGRTFRFKGFERSDFTRAFGPINLVDVGAVMARVRLHYQLQVGLDVMPLMTERDVAAALRCVREHALPAPDGVVPPTVERQERAVVVAVDAYWPRTCRIERHSVLLQEDGTVTSNVTQILVDAVEAKY